MPIFFVWISEKGDYQMWTCRTATILYLLLTGFSLANVSGPLVANGATASPDDVAMVNGTPIAKADLEREVGLTRQRLLSMGGKLDPSRVSELTKGALEELIDRQLLYQESQKKGVRIDGVEIDKRLTALRKRFSSEVEFQNALNQMNLSVDSIEYQFRQSLAIQQYVDKEIALKVTVSEKEVRTYYDENAEKFKEPEQVRASHILIQVAPGADEAEKTSARQKLTDVQNKLKKGGDFSALAKEFSQGPSGANGGDLGYFGRGQMVKPFEEAAFALKPGEVSDIVETNFGYHLIKVVDKQSEGVIAYQDIKDRLQQYLVQTEVQKRVDQHVKDLKEKAEIKRYLPED